MSTLHILDSADNSALQQLLPLITQHDSLLLLANGVYHCADSAVLALAEQQAVYLMGDDIDSRGLQSLCADSLQRCDYNDFVRLCCEHQNSVSW